VLWRSRRRRRAPELPWLDRLIKGTMPPSAAGSGRGRGALSIYASENWPTTKGRAPKTTFPLLLAA